MRRWSGLTLVEALIVFVALCGSWWALVPGLRHARPGPRSARCPDARHLGLAAIQYADGSYFPHVPRELDWSAGAADPRRTRLLVDWGYVDGNGCSCSAFDDEPLLVWGLGPPGALLVLLFSGVLLGRRGARSEAG